MLSDGMRVTCNVASRHAVSLGRSLSLSRLAFCFRQLPPRLPRRPHTPHALWELHAVRRAPALRLVLQAQPAVLRAQLNPPSSRDTLVVSQTPPIRDSFPRQTLRYINPSPIVTFPQS